MHLPPLLAVQKYSPYSLYYTVVVPPVINYMYA